VDGFKAARALFKAAAHPAAARIDQRLAQSLGTKSALRRYVFSATACRVKKGSRDML